jgi:alpha-glucosidase
MGILCETEWRGCGDSRSVYVARKKTGMFLLMRMNTYSYAQVTCYNIFRTGYRSHVIGALPSCWHNHFMTPDKSFQVHRDGSGFDCPLGVDTLSVTFVRDDVVRVRIIRPGTNGPEASWAVLPSEHIVAQANVAEFKDSILAVTPEGGVSVDIRNDTFSVLSAHGDGLMTNITVTREGESTTITWNCPPDRRVYGCGEKTGGMDRRGRRMVMWNKDKFEYGEHEEPIYYCIPFCVSLDGGLAHGLFVDNTWKQIWEPGDSGSTQASVTLCGGDVDFYVFTAPDVKTILNRFTELTGRQPLPPLWSLGYHQSRYSYYPESEVRSITEEFRKRRYPCDVIHFDIHYMDAYKDFTWDPVRFPDPPKLLSDLNEIGIRSVIILDPGIKVEDGYPAYESLLESGCFARNPDGTPFVGEVWPGPSIFPDVTDGKCRSWWGDQMKVLDEIGAGGWWLDLTEPEVFLYDNHTMPDDVVFPGEDSPRTHAQVHNIYGMQLARATYEGALRHRPEERPFVLFRSGYAGAQRYGATWTGDNAASWEHYRLSIRMVLGLGLSGQAFSGPDIGGFAGDPSPELLTRWLQVGALMPFCRVHNAIPTPDGSIETENTNPQEPWAHGEPSDTYNRTAIERRYRLLPYLYTVFEENSRTGAPVMRPFLMEYQDDPRAVTVEDAFLIGRDLLVAPIVDEGAVSRTLYLPRGFWRDYETGELIEGGRDITISAELDQLPMLVRAGAIIPTQEPVQHTGEFGRQRIIWRAYLDNEQYAKGELYEDDGISFGYRSRDCLRTTLRSGSDGTFARIIEGAYISPRPPDFVQIIGD